jgi:hypothetical protein
LPRQSEFHCSPSIGFTGAESDIVDNKQSTFLGLRTHHLVMALVAILIAVALASNYYLW